VLSLYKLSVSFLIVALVSSLSFADSESDRLLDLEAQVISLKSEVAATKTLAEQERASTFNPSISVIGDVIGQYGINVAKEDHDEEDHVHSFDNGVLVRGVEFEFRAAVDPWADVLVVLGIEPHGGHVDLHLEEAYTRLKKWPGLDFAPLGIEIKAGRFLTAIGRMNRIHLHNTPQISYPLAMKVFLGEEGYASQGVSLSASYPTSSSSAVTVFAEAITASKLPIQEKGAKEMASGVGHIWWHQELAPTHFLDLGASSLFGRRGQQGSGLFYLAGGDAHYSYLPNGYGQNPLFLMGSELYAANNVDSGRWPLGNFTWAQVKLIGSTFFGARYDLAPQEQDLQAFQHGIGAYFSYYTTEFLRFRLGYEHLMPSVTSFDGDHRFMLSMNFIMGSHPVEPYFINR